MDEIYFEITLINNLEVKVISLLQVKFNYTCACKL